MLTLKTIDKIYAVEKYTNAHGERAVHVEGFTGKYLVTFTDGRSVECEYKPLHHAHMFSNIVRERLHDTLDEPGAGLPTEQRTEKWSMLVKAALDEMFQRYDKPTAAMLRNAHQLNEAA